MKTENIRKSIWAYIGIILIYLLSGSYLYWGYAQIFLSMALLYVFFICLVSRSFFDSDFWKSFSFLYILLVLICLIFWGIDDNTYLTYLIIPLFSYHFFRFTSFDDFRVKWLKITTIISIWSLIAFVFFMLDILTPQEILVGDKKFNLVLGINIRINEFRLCGLSFEPGVFQIFLLYTLLMWVKNIRLWNFSKQTRNCLLICVIALLATQSTMGYIGLIVVLGAIFASNNYIKKNRGRVLGLIFLFVPLTIGIIQSSIVQDKFLEKDGNESYSIRIIDATAAYEMFEDSPILGNGIGKRWANIAASHGNITNSNGVLNMLSRLGVFWLVLYVFYTIKGCKRNLYEINPIYFVFAVLFPLLNEDIVYTPLAFIFVSSFSRFTKLKLIQNKV